MKKNQGFTLIELLIVVEIIAIVAAIAFPNYIRTRIQTNEAAAVASLRVILDAQNNYNTQNYVYAESFAQLTSANPPYLTGGDWNAPRNGYRYRVTGEVTNFVAHAEPVEYDVTGWHGFRIDASGAVRYAVGEEAGPDSPVLQGSN